MDNKRCSIILLGIAGIICFGVSCTSQKSTPSAISYSNSLSRWDVLYEEPEKLLPRPPDNGIYYIGESISTVPASKSVFEIQSDGSRVRHSYFIDSQSVQFKRSIQSQVGDRILIQLRLPHKLVRSGLLGWTVGYQQVLFATTQQRVDQEDGLLIKYSVGLGYSTIQEHSDLCEIQIAWDDPDRVYRID